MAYHRLADKDYEARTAVCSICGPVRLRKYGPNWRCAEVTRLERRRDKIRAKYGLYWRDWEALLIAQSGRCAICESPMRDPNVDHCHQSGQVRGLLCPTCNQGLGLFLDDPVRLRAALAYLGE